MRKHSKMYVFWVEFTKLGNILYKCPIVWNNSIRCFTCSKPFIGKNSSTTLGVWFEPDNFRNSDGNKTPLVKKEFAFRKTETYDQYISTWLEWQRKYIQRHFDKQLIKAPAEFKLECKVRYGRANSKECPFYVPQNTIKEHYKLTCFFRSAITKNVTIYQKINC